MATRVMVTGDVAGVAADGMTPEVREAAGGKLREEVRAEKVVDRCVDEGFAGVEIAHHEHGRACVRRIGEYRSTIG